MPMVTSFSSKSLKGMLRVDSKDITEVVDIGVTTKSSVAMYIVGPFTYPLLFPLVNMVSTKSTAVIERKSLFSS